MKNILIYRIGPLGENLVAIPSIWVIKKSFPEARLYLLAENRIGHKRLTGREIFEGSEIFEDYYYYPVFSSGWKKLVLPFFLLILLIRLRLGNFHMLIYLTPSIRSPRQIKRDRFFFRLAGINNLIGTDGFYKFPEKTVNGYPLIPSETDLLLIRLKASGLIVPEIGFGKMELNLHKRDEETLNSILNKFKPNDGRPWIGIGPGASRTVNLWPAERYLEVIRRIVKKYKVWPIVFGGEEDKNMGEFLIKEWGCGYNLAGVLPVRSSISAMKRCQLFLGNDTGTIHIAALAKVPCVGVFSSRNYPGQWFPYGSGHKIFYKHIECEGCGLDDCIENHKKCILSIQVDEVTKTCEVVLNNTKMIKC